MGFPAWLRTKKCFPVLKSIACDSDGGGDEGLLVAPQGSTPSTTLLVRGDTNAGEEAGEVTLGFGRVEAGVFSGSRVQGDGEGVTNSSSSSRCSDSTV